MSANTKSPTTFQTQKKHCMRSAYLRDRQTWTHTADSSCVLASTLSPRGMVSPRPGTFFLHRKVLVLLLSSQCILCLVLEHGRMPVGRDYAYEFRSRLPLWQGMRLRGGSNPFEQLLTPAMMNAVDSMIKGVDEDELSRMMGFPSVKSAPASPSQEDIGGEKVRARVVCAPFECTISGQIPAQSTDVCRAFFRKCMYTPRLPSRIETAPCCFIRIVQKGHIISSLSDKFSDGRSPPQKNKYGMWAAQAC
jgi:hypothetical protein